MNNNLALVVDDSKLAQAVLKKLLVEQGLSVDTTASAEEALVYLYTRQPDVIFMDHTMPGMDGLIAVKAIKNNPKTAMIPIMMYTSKEGEMYVSQARALGAVGVLPKQLAPAEVKKVLDELKLLPGQSNTYTSAIQPEANGTNEPFLESFEPALINNPEVQKAVKQKPIKKEPPRLISHVEVTEAANTASDYQANKALKNNLQELFENQTALFQSDLETSTNQISDKVFDNIEDDLSLRLDEIFEERKPEKKSGFSFINMALVVTIMSGPFIWLSYENLTLNKKLTAYSEENQTLKESLALNKDQLNPNSETTSHNGDAQKNNPLYNTIEWAINQNNSRPYNEPAFGSKALVMLSTLIPQLEDANFKGVVKLVSHRGQFCFSETGVEGSPNLADENAPVIDCIIPDAQAVSSLSLADQQTIEFSNYLSSLAGEKIKIEIENKGAQTPMSNYPETDSTQTAGNWNKVAQQNNRLEVVILPTDKSMVVDL